MPKCGLAVLLLTLGVVAILVTVGASELRRAADEPGDSPLASAAGSPLPGISPAYGSVVLAPAFSPAPSTTVLGPLPGGTPLTVAVSLASSDPGGLAAYLAAEYAAGTPARSHFLSSSVLAQRFGASGSEVDAARAYFASEGLSVTVSPDDRLVFVEGPASALGRAFGTTFVEYRSASGQEFFSHPTPAALPRVAPWSGAFGLGSLNPLVPATSSLGSSRAIAGPAASCEGTVGVLVPCQVWNAYDLQPLIANGTNGSGFRIGIVDAYSSSESQSDLEGDLAAFVKLFGLPTGNVDFLYPVPTTVDLNASDVNSGWAAEDALDLEWARAAAPGATIDFAFSPNAGIGLYEAVDWLVAHQAVNVISLSWGEPDVGVYNAFDTPCAAACNATTDGSYAILSPVLELAAAEGISVFAASGDCGSADGTSGVSTNYPASDPSVTGVGGTVLNVTSNGTYLSEEGWSGNATGATSPGCQNQGGSGGGYAPFPRPWWQSGLPSSPSTRGVPDVALDAGTHATIFLDGNLANVGGTSLSTPVWAGIAGDLDQFAGRPLGFLDPALYRILAGPNYSDDFHDIVSGGNGYSAGPGWDPVTGIGTPIVANLSRDIVSLPSVGWGNLSTNLTARPVAGNLPLAVTFAVGATGGTDSYPIEGVYFGDGTAAFAPGGEALHVYNASGVYAAQSYVVDSSGNVSASSPALVVAGGGGILDVALSASNTTPAPGGPVILSASVSGGTAPYLYSYYFGDGSFLNSTASASVEHTYGVAGGFCASVVVSDAADPVDGGLGAGVGIAVGGVPVPDCRPPYPPLTIRGGPSVETGPAPLTVSFTAEVSGGYGAPYGYAWQFGDGGRASNAASVDHTFRSAGTYRVELNVSDAVGDRGSATWNVTVNGSAPMKLGILWVIAPALAAGTVVSVAMAVWNRRRAPPTGSAGPPNP